MKASTETAGDMLQRLGDDGMKWAEEFCKRFPSVPVDDALGWFCNAIENCWDVRMSRMARSDEAWADLMGQVGRLRAMWREFESSEPQPRDQPVSPPIREDH